MFNGQKPHHPNVRFFLYFAERRGPGCCCARADKKVGSNLRFSRYAPRNGQLGRPTRSLCSAGPESSGSIRCLLLRTTSTATCMYMYRLLYMDDSRNRACSTPTAFSSRFYRTVLFWLPLAGTKYEPITKSCK